KPGDKEVEEFARKMRKSLGDKRNELGEEHIIELARLAAAFEDGPYTKIFDTTVFGYRKITVERPLRLNFQVSPERIARLHEEKAFQNLGGEKKPKNQAQIFADGEVSGEQATILAALGKLDPTTIWTNRAKFERVLDSALWKLGMTAAPPLKKAI